MAQVTLLSVNISDLNKMINNEMTVMEYAIRNRISYTCGLCGGRVINGICVACKNRMPPKGNKYYNEEE